MSYLRKCVIIKLLSLFFRSIGCIIFELCCQRHAFEGQGLMGVMYKIVEGDCPQIPDKYSKNLQELLKK